jgi:hypothetical protein
MSITPDQVSAARRLLGWSLIRLSNHSGVRGGVEFSHGRRPGVRLAGIQDRERTGKDFI